MVKGTIGVALLLGTVAALAMAQQPPGRFPAEAIKPQESGKPRDLSKLPPLPRHLHLSAVRGLDWLVRANQPDGKFIPGFLPALGAKSDGEAFLPQVDATAALLRGGRVFGDERALALGKQALLRVLQETTFDTTQQVRYPAVPEALVNRTAGCGAILRAIHELPQPAEDVAAQGRQISFTLQRQLRVDGTFAFATDDPKVQRLLIRTCSGPALAGLARAERQGPGAEAVRRACVAHVALWRQDKQPELVPALSAACAEAFLAGGEVTLAQAVFEMNDWLLTLQYPSDGQQSAWSGGFMPWKDGEAATLPPDAGTAALAASLVEGCRVARKASDLVRLERYRNALESALRFVSALQYTEARVQHFAEWYRPWILGGFHQGLRNGDLSLSDNHHAVAALLGYVEHVSE